jgi:polysaccharide deacetylase family protein (PEP-CTERM system associated)
MSQAVHAFSVDVEDWYQSSFDNKAPISERCVRNTRVVLDFLRAHGIRGTFFVQGLVARAYPGLIRQMHKEGHEIQSHGFSHLPVSSLGPAGFKKELTETSRLIEDITGEPVTGYRAPDFSIDRETFWAFEVMCECGIRYDSSIFPLRTRRYGINGFEAGYSVIETPSGRIEELPVSVYEPSWLRGVRVPVGGGGYFRLFPSWFLVRCLRAMDAKLSPFVIYCHPYEFNPGEWASISAHIPAYRRLHQGLGRRGFQGKVSRLLKTETFGTMSDVLKRFNGGETRCG